MSMPTFEERMSKLKVALGHDFLNQWGGAERVMMAFREIFPDSDVYSTTYDESKVGHKIDFVPKTSFIQKLPFGKSKYKMYFWLMPKAVEKFDFSAYDLVLTDSSNYIKGCVAKPPTVSVCYLHTPVRYLTFEPEYFKDTAPRFLHPIMPFILKYLKRKDAEAVRRPHWMIANSQTTARRMEEHYGRKADDVVFPPVDSQTFQFSEEDSIGDYFLVVGRLVPYKRADLVIQAANQLKVGLVIVGDGPMEAEFRKQAGPTIEFVGSKSDAELRELYARCRALVFPQIEDAGITPLEAMCCGRPVVAFRSGGALESVKEGVSGCFFDEQTVDSLAKSLRSFDPVAWDPNAIRTHALQFDTEAFKRRIIENVDRAMQKVRGKVERN